MLQELRSVVIIATLFAASMVFAQNVTEIPPHLPDPMVAGGRVHAIAVNPRYEQVVVIANEFAGLWKTEDGGFHWAHLDGLDELWVGDVVWTNGGTRLVATVAHGYPRSDNDGIWFSDDRGVTWHPSDYFPNRYPGLQLSAHGLSVAPDNDRRVYAATDIGGVATSSDGGRTWTWRMVRAPEPPVPCHAVQALPRDRAIAVCHDGGVFRRDSVSGPWRRIRSLEGFSGWSQQMIDVSPVDSDHVFIMASYTELLLYRVASEEWISIPLPGGESRNALVKIARGPQDATEIFAGTGQLLRRIVRTGVDEFRRITAQDWEGTSGAHDDSGDLALDPAGRALYFGSDGGLFRSADGGRTWTPAATAREGMNSLQISDLTGTNILQSNGWYQTTLYITTQDNQNWASSDGGGTWSNRDGNEGCCLSAPHQAPSAADAQVGYLVFGWARDRGHPRFADAEMLNPRHISNADADGLARDLTMLAAPVYVEPNVWVRVGSAAGMGPVGIWVSTDNGASWRLRAQVALPYRGGTQASGRSILTSFAGTGGRIGILRIDDVTARGMESFDASHLIYPSGNGSLAVRATMFDWHAVFAVDPTDAQHIVAVDAAGDTLTELRGSAWTPLTELTALVRRGPLFAHAYRSQVTLLKFDPYRRDRIWVGTRDKGLFVHDSGGHRPVAGTKSIKYITGVFTTPTPVSYVASYGRGLWKINESPPILRLPPELNICNLRPQPIQCLIHVPGDPQRFVFDPAPWRNLDLAVVLGGQITGIRSRRGLVRTIEVTPGARIIRPNAPDVPLPFSVVQTTRARGLGSALDKNTIATGVVLQKGKLQAFVSGERPLSEADLVSTTEGDEPRLLLTSKHPATGVTIVSAGEAELSFYGIDFEPNGGPVALFIDGRYAGSGKVLSKGETSGVVSLPRLAAGLHWLVARQGQLNARTEFVVVDTEAN